MRRSSAVITAVAIAAVILWTAWIARSYLPHGITGSLFDASALWRGWFPIALRAWYLDAFIAVILGFAALCNGAWLLDRLGLESESLDCLVLGTSLGFAALAISAALLGAVHLFYPAPLRVLMALFVAASLWKWPRELATLRALSPLALSAPFLVMTLAAAAVPETAYDALGWHLPAARSFLQHGTFSLLDLYRTNVPHYGTVFYALGLALHPGSDFRGESAARMLTFLLLPGIGLAAAAITRRLSATHWFALSLAALWIVSCPDVMAQAVTCCPDLGSALWVTLAVLAALGADSLATGALAGIFAGMAAGTKFAGLYAIPAAGAALIVARQSRRTLALFVCCAAVIAAPWYARNYVFTGDPVPPVFQKYLAHPAIDLNDAAAIRSDLVNPDRVPVTLTNFLAIPWRLTMEGDRFTGAIGLPFLFALPFAFCGARREAPWLALAAALPVFASLWLIGPQWTRYFIPALAMGAAIGVAGIFHPRVPSGVRAVACAVGVLITIANAPGMNRLWSGGGNDVLLEIPWRAAFGNESEALYRHTHIPSYDAAQFLNTQSLPADTVVRDIPAFHFFPPWLTRFRVLSFWESRQPAQVLAVRRDATPLDFRLIPPEFRLLDYIEGTFLFVRGEDARVFIADFTPPQISAARPLEGDERMATFLDSGASLQRSVDLPDRAELDFALGQHAGDVIGDAVTDLSVTVAGSPVVAHRFGPDEAEHNWQYFRVPLSYPGKNVPIVFSTAPAPERRGSRLVIADPIVWALR